MAIETTEENEGAVQAPHAWWQRGVLYQIYPRSFADSDGDGTGDLRGITARLDHLAWLGIDAIWLNPTTPSPNEDWGYDVSDYCDVHPDLGTLADMDALIAAADARGIRIILDLVPNHTSDQHAWFQDALTGRDAQYRDFYVWSDPGPDGGPPNNWVSDFAGSAWTFHEPTGQYYLHNFLPSQPDLNWWNPAVRAAFDDVLRFWFERGVAGFRIDVAQAIVKDRELRDDPVAQPDDHPRVRELGLKPVYSMNRPEVHDVLRRFRAVATAQRPERILVGETYVFELEQLVPYYGDGTDELHLAFNFIFMHAPLEAPALREIVETIEAELPAGAWPVWAGSNHDGGRFARRWAGGSPDRARCALMMLLGLRGTPFLYYGDEIAMDEVPIDPQVARDPVARRTGDASRNRDPGRTPMQWTPTGGFGPGDAEPWLPAGDASRCNVADQRDDPASTLHLARDLIALRRARTDLGTGAYKTLPAPDGAWAWQRGDGTAVVLNLAGSPADVDLAGQVLIGTDRRRDGQRFDGRLAPWEGVVLALDATRPA
ncbi:Oligo-1,6-glucosidase 1 [Baekduia alba]|uniref:alpha-amylase family glycosyl hydrolase n=1 Tax=Baekduia alba TaxID=2997333 RepID=UPI0023405A95|nr:alpha-amylase family glycosyl hydrolase [Baekduia alba]WCB91826.1 Oligo-1,6-glucosidase 1 [Baekduia alba]